MKLPDNLHPMLSYHMGRVRATSPTDPDWTRELLALLHQACKAQRDADLAAQATAPYTGPNTLRTAPLVVEAP